MLTKRKPQVGQRMWTLLLAVGWTVLGSARGSSSSSSSDFHLLSPTPGAPRPPAMTQPEAPRHHQPPVSMHRSPASLRVGHGESCRPRGQMDTGCRPRSVSDGDRTQLHIVCDILGLV